MKRILGFCVLLVILVSCCMMSFATMFDDCVIQKNISAGYIEAGMLSDGAEVMFELKTPKGRTITYNKDHSCPYFFDYRNINLVDGSGTYILTFYDRVAGGWRFVRKYSFYATSNNNNKYLVAGSEAESDNAYVRQTALSITSGIPTNYDKARALNTWIRNNITYNYDEYNNPSNYVNHGAIFTLASRTGICHDMAGTYTAMSRSLGLQTKVVHGYYKGGYHAWCQVYIPELGRWISSDPTNQWWDTQLTPSDYVVIGDYAQDN